MNNFKKIRLRRNLTQVEVANALHISQSAYSFYEKGRNEPNVDILLNLSKIYNVSIDELLGNDYFIVNNDYENMLPVPTEKKATVELLCQLPDEAFQNVKGQIEIYSKYYGII